MHHKNTKVVPSWLPSIYFRLHDPLVSCRGFQAPFTNLSCSTYYHPHFPFIWMVIICSGIINIFNHAITLISWIHNRSLIIFDYHNIIISYIKIDYFSVQHVICILIRDLFIVTYKELH